MDKLFSALTLLVGSMGDITLDEVRKIRNRLAMLIGYLFFACIGAFVLNAEYGYRIPSLILAVAIIAWAFWVWVDPLNLAMAVGMGVVRKIAARENLATAVREIFKVYLEDVLQWPLLVTTTFLLVTGTVSYKGSPEAVLPLIVAACLIWFLIWKFPIVFKGTVGRRLIYAFAVSVVVVNVVPGPWWTKYLHWDPTTAKPTAVEESLYAFGRAEKETADTDRAKELDRITDNVKRHRALTEADKLIIVEAKQSQSREKPPVSKPQALVQTICKDASSQETLTCLMTPKLSTGIKIALMADSGKQLCFVPSLPFEKNDINGTTFWQFKTDGGQVEMKYRLFPADEQCSDVVF